MMKRLFLTALSCLTVAVVMMAGPVSREAAQQKAADFLKGRNSRAAGKVSMAGQQQCLTPVSDAEQAYWYAFNVGEGEGFVIVSGDDRTDAILGYSDSGSIDEQNMPSNMRAWLQGYADEIKYICDHNLDAAAVRGNSGQRRATVLTEIPVLMLTHWDQGAPYYLETPMMEKKVLNADGSTSKVPTHCVTGCVATAMAQVMYYQVMKTGTNTQSTMIPGYTNNYTYVEPIGDLPATSFDWQAMKLVYDLNVDENNPTAAESAVAHLMRYCGQAVKMEYGLSSSGALLFDVVAAMKKYFGYDDEISFVDRNNFGYNEWVEMMYNELKTNGPVLYGGQSMDGGHCFVLDGYASDDYFHVNWGWSGYSDGYFKLSVLYPSQQGIGGSTSLDGFNNEQQAIINLKPVADEETSNQVLSVFKMLPTTNSLALGEYLPITLTAYNCSGTENTFSVGFGLYDADDNRVLLHTLDEEKKLDPLYGWTNRQKNAPLPTDLEDGIYKLFLVSKLSTSDTWEKCKGSSQHFITLEISNGQATVLSGSAQLAATFDNCPSEMHVNESYDLDITLTNSGNIYSGDLMLMLINDNSSYIISPIQTEVKNGEQKRITIPFAVNSTYYEGTVKLVLRDRDNNVVGSSEDITITSRELSTDIDLAATTEFDNLNEARNKIVGNSIKVKAIIINTSDTDYYGRYSYQWKRLDPETNEYTSYNSLSVRGYASVPANSTAVLRFEIKNIDVTKKHAVQLYCENNKKLKAVGQETAFYPVETNVIRSYLTDGTTVIDEAREDYQIPFEATSVDLTSAGVTAVKPNPNPNTIYFLSEDAEIPTSLTGLNIVKGDNAEQITLTDDYDFASPVDFTADAISYTRTETLAADGTDGWSTIVLPFDVAKVTADGEEIDWFHNSNDAGKNFWLKEFVTDSENNVYFDFADKMVANMPYIIALPGNKWGKKWDLTNKEIKFMATNASVKATLWTQLNGENFKFVGSMKATDANNIYVLNEAGNSFTLRENANVAPFRGYFSTNSWLSPYPRVNIASLNIVEPEEDGGVATSLPADPAVFQPNPQADTPVFDLQGRRVSKPTAKGLYIMNGRKVVVK